MNTSQTSLLPVEQTERIYSLDILRGIVLLGILLMNIVGYDFGELTGILQLPVERMD